MNCVKVFLVVILLFLQPKKVLGRQNDLLESYNNYSELEREIAYLHLNKNIYLKEESIWFTAYVFNKNDKLLSEDTKNLYCTIYDSSGKKIKEKLILINNGIGYGSFETDSLLPNTNYIIKAYTNWMKNFDEPNHFEEKIKVIDETYRVNGNEGDISKIDIQLLPESGHLLSNVTNTLGIIIKNNKGFGVPNIEGMISKKGSTEIISKFKVNNFGIGKTKFNPENGVTYEASFKIEDKDYVVPIMKSESIGLTMSVENLENEVILTFRTNSKTLPLIKEKLYKLFIHNGYHTKQILFSFNDRAQVKKVIQKDKLFKGVNIFTVFNMFNEPILERLYFNYEGISFLRSNKDIEINYQTSNDSLEIEIPYLVNEKDNFHNLSVSILPQETRSYNRHQNIASQVLLQPYVNNLIQDGAYYFNDINIDKFNDLDNLLLTQGWSSYDWNDIFNNPPEENFDFEQGINYFITTKEIKDRSLIIYPNFNTKTEIINLHKEDSIFERVFYPLNGEKLRIGEFNINGKIIMPDIDIKFDKLKVSQFNRPHKKQFPLFHFQNESLLINEFNPINNKIERLQTVEIIEKREYTRIEKLQRRSYGEIEIFDELKKAQFKFFGNYISRKGYFVEENFGVIRIRSNRLGEAPIIYIDDQLVTNNITLFRYDLESVDYIEINKSGAGSGFSGRRGGNGGVIKIYTDPNKKKKTKGKSIYKEYEIPLAYNRFKHFYKPKYTSYDKQFFKFYGVIDWLPNLKIDHTGSVKFKIQNSDYSNIRLFIEGVLEDGTLISEIKDLKLISPKN